MTTSTLTKTTLTPRQTGTRTFADTFGNDNLRDVCEVKARLEFNKDQAAWALALSRNPYVACWSSDNLVVSATFVMGEPADQGLKQLQNDIIDIYWASVRDEMFAGRGIEPHVLIESLKLADEFDGRRDGPLSDHDEEGNRKPGSYRDLG